MKPLTKTVASRSGGIAARFAADEKPTKPRGANTVANPAVANKPRYERWRDKNPELYKTRQAAYMRKMRAKAKET